MKYFLKHKLLFAVYSFLIVFGIGFTICFINSKTFNLELDYDKNLKIDNVLIEFKDNNGNNIEANLKNTYIKNIKGKTKLKFKAIKKGDANLLVTLNFEENDYMNSKRESNYIKVNTLNMIFNGHKFSDLVSYNVLYYTLIIYIGIISIFMFICFKNELKNNKYSYNSIFYGAGFIFSLILFLIYISGILATIIIYKEINIKMLSLITSNAMMFFIIASIPVIFIFALLLNISNVKLMKMEGKNKYNALGIIFSFIIITGLLVLTFLVVQSRINHLDSLFYLILYSIAASLFVLFESILFSTIICSIYVLKKKVEYNKDYIIILGCGIRKDGTLTPLLQGRVDKAIEFYNKQYNETGKKLKFVVSGGQGSDEVIAEGEAMKNYLLLKKFNDSEIIVENKSTNTLENIKFSMKLINNNVVISTTNYHVFRTGLTATSLNYKIDVIGSKTKWYFWPNAFVREIVGILVRQRKQQILVILLISISAAISAIIYTMFL